MLKNSKLFKISVLCLICSTSLKVPAVYANTIYSNEVQSEVQLFKQPILQSEESNEELSKEELLDQIYSLIEEAKAIGIEFNCIDSNVINSSNNDELLDMAFDLKFSTMCQEKANASFSNNNIINDYINNFERVPEGAIINEDDENSILRSDYSEYITRNAGKVYYGDATVNLNGKTKPYRYGVNVYVDYCYRAYTDRFGDAATSLYSVRQVTSTKGMNVDIGTFKNYVNLGGYLANDYGSSFMVRGNGRFTVGVTGLNYNVDVPYQATFDCGDGSYVTSSTTPPR